MGGMGLANLEYHDDVEESDEKETSGQARNVVRRFGSSMAKEKHTRMLQTGTPHRRKKNSDHGDDDTGTYRHSGKHI